MAKLYKKQTSTSETEDEHAAARAVRQEFGILELDDDEELSDDASFDMLQEIMVRARQEAEGGTPTRPSGESQGAPNPQARPKPPRRNRDSHTEELLLEEIANVPARARGASKSTSLPAPPATPGEVTRLEAEIHSARNRDDIARHSLRLGRRYASALALFVVNRGMVVGLRCEADGVKRPIESVIVPADVDSFFAPALNCGKPQRGVSPGGDVDARVLRAMGRPQTADRLLVPVILRGRVINLLYADNGPDGLAETSAAALCSLGACIASAYEYSILASKRLRS